MTEYKLTHFNMSTQNCQTNFLTCELEKSAVSLAVDELERDYSLYNQLIGGLEYVG